MTALGLIVRCDHGGLGTQTWEAWRHLRPAKTLVLDFSFTSRGACDPTRYDGDEGIQRLSGYPSPSDIRRFLDGLDVVFTCETFYSPDWVDIARELGVDCVVQANPEMWDGEARGARVVLPTAWERNRVPNDGILPVPIALDRFTQRHVTEARTFYHPAAPAMADRNGTGILLSALAHVTAEITVYIRGARDRGAIARRPTRVPKNVTLIEVGRTEDPYWTAYPPETDVVVLPRRYGGLCLPAQEAAAMGCPVVMTDLAPQKSWPHVELVRATSREQALMKGGSFTVSSADPRHLAKAIDRLVESPARVQSLSSAALAWAESMSWERLLPRYREVLTSHHGATLGHD